MYGDINVEVGAVGIVASLGLGLFLRMSLYDTLLPTKLVVSSSIGFEAFSYRYLEL